MNYLYSIRIFCSSVVGEKAQLSPHGPHHLPQLGRHRLQGVVQLLRPLGDSVPGPDGAHAARPRHHRDRLRQLQVTRIHFAKPIVQDRQKVRKLFSKEK